MTPDDTGRGSALDIAAEAVARQLRTILVAVRSPAGGGSGTAWGRDGLVITNSHVVESDRAEVLTGDGQAYPARLAARDPVRDLAALRVEGTFPAVAEPRLSPPLRVGELVFAMGNPWGEPGVLTRGVVMARGPATGANDLPLADAVTADVRLAPGNSGGPLADAAGRVVGINSMIAGGIAVAVPAAAVVAFLDGDGTGYLGIVARSALLPSAVAARFEGDGIGLLLTGIEPGSPANRAGLLPGDLVLRLDDGPGGSRALARTLRSLRPGRPLQIEVLRGGRVHRTTAKPVARS